MQDDDDKFQNNNKLIYVFYIIIMNKELFSLLNKNFHQQNTLTVKEMEQRILSKKQNRKDNGNLLKDKSNVNFMNVISPFYDKNKVCVLKNCFCPYHKRIRQESMKKRYQNYHKNNNNTGTNSPNKNLTSMGQNRMGRGSYKPSAPKHEHLQSINERLPSYEKVSSKLQSFNIQYERFINMYGKMMKNSSFVDNGEHIVKTPVWQIFYYIYHHLDDEKAVIQKYIDSLEKDRNMKQFYLERFDDLQCRKNQIKIKSQSINMLQLNNTTGLNNQKYKHSYNFYRTLKDSKMMTQKSSKSAFKKLDKNKKKDKLKGLIIQLLIQKLQKQDDIQEKNLLKFISLNQQQFIQNIKYLKENIKKIDLQILQSIKQQILLPAKESLQSQLTNQQENELINYKIMMISQLLNSIDEEIKLNEEEQERDSIFQQAQLLMSKKIRLNRMSERKQSIRKSGSIKEKLMKEFMSLHQNNGSSNSKSSKRQSEFQQEKGMTVQQQDQTNNNDKNQNIILQKQYRIYSHGFFSRKKKNSKIYSDQKQNALALQQLKNLQDVEIYLKTLTSESLFNKKKMIKIQSTIKEQNIQKLMINEDESLITMKRKIRAVKILIQDERTVPQLRSQLKEYMILAQKQTLAKNYNWAYAKLKHIVVNSNEIEIYDGQIEDQKILMKSIISDIFYQAKRLYFYDVSVTSYTQKEVNFQDAFFQSIKNVMNHNEKKVSEYNRHSYKKNDLSQHQINIKYQKNKRKETDNLMQVGLQNRYVSQYNYMQTINYKNTGHPNTIDQTNTPQQ